jgi:hypothetical protein
MECPHGNFDETPGADVFDESSRRARKTHVCCECGQLINPGERYQYVRGLWDGAWQSFKTCEICVRIRRDIFPCGYEYGTLREFLRTEVGIVL